MNRFYAATCQTDFPFAKHSKEIKSRVSHMCEMVENTLIGYEPFHDVRLFVFPEFAHTPPVYSSVSELRNKLAVPIPNEHTHRYHQLAKKQGCYIQTGTFLEAHPDYPEHVFNTTLLIGPEGILSTYRKTNPWIPWEVHSSPHDFEDFAEEIFPVAHTELGVIGVAICYDWLFPEVLRQLTFNGAEILIRVSAYMDPWGRVEPMDWWTTINRTRALENCAYVVACNQGASYQHYPPFSWPGGSMVVDFDGRILAQTASAGERIVIAPIDIDSLRYERKRRIGHDTITHSRNELYTYLNSPGFTRQQKEVPSTESLTKQIRELKQNRL